MISTLILLLCAVSHSLAANCPGGFKEVAGIGCFYFGQGNAGSWDEANAFCRSIGSYLVEVTSEEEEYKVLQLALQNPGDYWSGLTDRAVEGTFVWGNSETYPNLTTWATNQPDGGVAENCVAMKEEKSYFWTDEDCDLLLEPLCESAFLLNPCGSGWDYISQFDSCYLLSGSQSSSMSWSSAVNFCKNLGQGTYLAEIKSQEEQDALSASINSNGGAPSVGYWIGLSDNNAEGKYIWETSGEVATFFDWGPGQPDSQTRGNCISLFENTNFKWHDTACGETFAWYPLCERGYNGSKIDVV